MASRRRYGLIRLWFYNDRLILCRRYIWLAQARLCAVFRRRGRRRCAFGIQRHWSRPRETRRCKCPGCTGRRLGCFTGPSSIRGVGHHLSRTQLFRRPQAAQVDAVCLHCIWLRSWEFVQLINNNSLFGSSILLFFHKWIVSRIHTRVIILFWISFLGIGHSW